MGEVGARPQDQAGSTSNLAQPCKLDPGEWSLSDEAGLRGRPPSPDLGRTMVQGRERP